MQSAVAGLGHKARVIDYLSRDQNSYKLITPLHPRHTLRVLGNFRCLAKRKLAFEKFAARFLNLTDSSYTYGNESRLEELQADYDCFICGSDQIWNLDCTHGVVEPFFLSFAGNRRRVAYAPSLAHLSFRTENFDKAKVSRLLADFDYLSVREAETLPLFQPLVTKSIDVVLDPTLLLDAPDYEPVVAEPVIEGGYIFMYLLRECPELIASTAAMAEESGMRVAYVSEKRLPIPNGVNLFGIGPSEFLSLIANADAVAANSFHAMVFSVLFHKPFRVFATDASGARMRDLAGSLGVESCCVAEEDSSAFTAVDWADVDERLAALREHSLSYLEEALA